MSPDQQDPWPAISTAMLTALAEISTLSDPAQSVSVLLSHILTGVQAQAAEVALLDRDEEVYWAGNLVAEAAALAAEWLKTLKSSGPLPALGDWAVHALSASNSLLAIPLASDTQPRGFLAIQLPKRHPFLDHRAEVTTWACALAGILDGQRKRLAAQKWVRQMDTLNEIVRALSSTLELQDLLQETMVVAAQVLGAEASTLMLLDAETDDLVFEITHGSTEQELRQYRMPKNKGIAGWVFSHNESVIANDPAADARFNRSVDQKTGFQTRSILCVPMQIKGKPIGVLQVLNKKRAAGFGANDARMLHALAGQAAIAIENARLYRSLREERDRIIRAQEDVRRELARDLHDGAVQLLAAIAMNIEHAKRLLRHDPSRLPDELDVMADMVRTATRQTRTLLFELRPIVLETRGLVAALESYVERLHEAGHGPEVDLHIDSDLRRFDQRIEKTVFAIVQEAVTNSRKHAQGSHISIHLVCTRNDLEVVVEDDGTGFDLLVVENEYTERDSLGLLNMKERAELLDGWLTIDAEPGKGTRVVLCVPLSTPTASRLVTTAP